MNGHSCYSRPARKFILRHKFLKNIAFLKRYFPLSFFLTYKFVSLRCQTSVQELELAFSSCSFLAWYTPDVFPCDTQRMEKQAQPRTYFLCFEHHRMSVRFAAYKRRLEPNNSAVCANGFKNKKPAVRSYGFFVHQNCMAYFRFRHQCGNGVNVHTVRSSALTRK